VSQESAIIKIVVQGLGGASSPERPAAPPVASTRATEPVAARSAPTLATAPTTLYQPAPMSARPAPAIPAAPPPTPRAPMPGDGTAPMTRAAQLPTDGLLQAFPWLRGPLGARAAEPTRETAPLPQARAPAAAALTAAPCDCICECISRAVDTIVAHMGKEPGGAAPKPAPARLTGGPEDQPEKKQKRPEVLTAKDLGAGIAMALGRTVAGHAQAIGSALGGSEGGIGVAAADVGLDLAQQIGPMFGPAGAAVGAASKAVAVGLQMVDAASRQAAKNITAYSSIQASLIGGDLIGAKVKYEEKQDEEHGMAAKLKDQLLFGPFGSPFADSIKRYFSSLPINTHATRAASLRGFSEMNQAATARANQLAPFSAQISTAQAQAKAQQIQTAAALAQEHGGKLARLTTAQGDYKTAVDQALMQRQAKQFDRLSELLEKGRITDDEMLKEMQELSKKQDVTELMRGDTAESKEFLAELVRLQKKAREEREKGGAFNVGKMVDDFFKNFGFLPTMPPPNPFAAPTPPMTPLTVP
jgi:hypothetical protein